MVVLLQVGTLYSPCASVLHEYSRDLPNLLSPTPSTLAVEPLKLDLKPLPDTLKYKFLGLAESLPMIIASNLYNAQEQKLLDVFKEHKGAIWWSIGDIKGINPSIVMHKIHLEENA